jgi:hypothetical protein
MTNNVNLAKIKAKIKALLAMNIDNGASENEAMVAMAKVGELLQQYNLSMMDIGEVREEGCITAQYTTDSKHSGVEVDVASVVAKFTSTKVWMVRQKDSIVLSFFGAQSDVDLANYLVMVVKNAYENEYAKFKMSEAYVSYTGHRRTLNTSFRRGFVHRVNARISDMINENNKAYAASTGTALVIVEKAKFVEEEFSKMNMKLRKQTRYQRTATNGSAYNAGSSAGNNVSFNRPVGGGNQKYIA